MLINAPISLAMSTRISNMGNLIADTGVGGFVVVAYSLLTTISAARSMDDYYRARSCAVGDGPD